VLCPVYREAGVIPQFLSAMCALDYLTDRLQVLFLTESNDGQTREAIASMRFAATFFDRYRTGWIAAYLQLWPASGQRRNHSRRACVGW
jgi:hypothetical protein